MKFIIIIMSGEFGVVYRGQLTGWDNNSSIELVAVKTLKGNTVIRINFVRKIFALEIFV